MEVVQLGGAQAGWSEEEASDVAQRLHDQTPSASSIPNAPQLFIQAYP